MSEKKSKEERKKILRKRLIIAAVALLMIVAGLAGMANVLTEYRWFGHLGFGSIYVTVLASRVGIGLVFGLVALIAIAIHIHVIRKVSSPRKDWHFQTPEGEIDLQQFVKKVSTPVVVAAGILAAAAMGVLASQHWEDVLKFLNATSFGHSEPVLKRDIGFYLFKLPTLEFVQEWLIYLTGLCLFFSAAVYFFRNAISIEGRWPKMNDGIRAHLLVALACVIAVIGWGFRLEMYETLFSRRGAVDGAGYADVYANLVAYRVLFFGSLLCGLYLIVNGLRVKTSDPKKAFFRPAIAVVSLVGLYGLGIFAGPYVIQGFVVKPNELDKERPYLAYAIHHTRAAYGLDKIKEIKVAANERLEPQALENNRPTIDNIKLWDPRPLRDTYRQLQELKTYYDFPNISIDRYRLETGYWQVMLSARELVIDQLPHAARTWVNRHLQYTHGYGVVLSPVNRTVGEGMPDLWLKDFPPVQPGYLGISVVQGHSAVRAEQIDAGSPAAAAGIVVGETIKAVNGRPVRSVEEFDESRRQIVAGDDVELTTSTGVRKIVAAARFASLKLDRPQIYYGLKTDDYAIVGTTNQEFDYPQTKRQGLDSKDVYTTYAGKGGVAIDGFLSRLFFSIRFADLKLFFTSTLTDKTRVLFNRSIQQRVHTVAPFLMLDQEPYVVIANKRLYWIQDAYTISYRHPYSRTTSLGRRQRINYIRNSVKVVIDAYDGTVDFYLWDETDPMIQTYKKIFPKLFKARGEMQRDLKAHVRYPKDLFTIQADMYQSFHMTDPGDFYRGQDLWAIAKRLAANSSDTSSAGPRQPGVSARQVTEQMRMQPYYMIMRLPEAKDEEFVLMVPFTMMNKDNLRGWLSARNDGEDYGRLLLYEYPEEKLVYGPLQIEARIDQDSYISQWITLRNQQGSKVIRGDLLVIPIEDAILYVQPIYLEATQAQLPELKQVIVAFGNKLAMKNTLAEALKAVFGVRHAAVAKRSEGEDKTSPALTAAQGTVAAQALSAYRRAQQLVKSGDWAGYGKAQQDLGQLLERLAKQLQSGLPSTPKQAPKSTPAAQPTAPANP
ncbi:MAG: UPF0182 family protein [Deltaproteobacteria bacterium]|nr:UPF0182 family protein [Deltaproteobacteria bacterium]